MPRAVPKLCRHTGSNQGYVTLSGRRIYLGVWGLPETEEAYHRHIAEWLANGRVVPVAGEEITVIEIARQYLDHVESCRLSNETKSLTRRILRNVLSLYASTPAATFGPRALKTIRQSFLDQNLSRKIVNAYVRETRRLFAWAVSEELIPGSVYHALQSVTGLTRQQCNTPDPAPITPVLDAHRLAIRPFVSRQIWGMIELQYYLACRPGEIVGLRTTDIDRSGAVWTATLTAHKSAHLGKTRTLYFGARAQLVLADFLHRPLGAYIFSPREAERDRHAAATGHRRDDQKPNAKKTAREVGACYSVDTYRRAITRACDAADVPRWTPHRLRHSAATRIRSEMGLEAAQVFLGHASADVTQIYAEVDRQKAVLVAEKMG